MCYWEPRQRRVHCSLSLASVLVVCNCFCNKAFCYCLLFCANARYSTRQDLLSFRCKNKHGKTHCADGKTCSDVPSMVPSLSAQQARSYALFPYYILLLLLIEEYNTRRTCGHLHQSLSLKAVTSAVAILDLPMADRGH